jgi:hypothetical protein
MRVRALISNPKLLAALILLSAFILSVEAAEISGTVHGFDRAAKSWSNSPHSNRFEFPGDPVRIEAGLVAIYLL